ncbi:glycosyl hydrolase 2 galactose-binding domain-containing protein [Variovorax boronicumulans]|uniref:glycosyl hydrolase 2 galactose-binding domain-containing protein n=1 Tax=Variovorax boronicumulans TaxID=436515 RepID=UPI003392A05F
MPQATPQAIVVFLHGLETPPGALLEFADVFPVPVVLCVPHGPVHERDGGRSWWPTAPAQRAARLAGGPGDLFEQHPHGRMEARQVLSKVLHELRERWPALPLVLMGYSQGAMLAVDQLLMGIGPLPDALALLSGTCIALDEWLPRLQPSDSPVRDLPVLSMHGEHDQELSVAAGLRLRDCLAAAGARVQWRTFDGGHEMPPAVWRRLGRFLMEQLPLPNHESQEGQISRRSLPAQWELCCQVPAVAACAAPGPRDGWLRIERPLPVAAALADLGLFSLDGPSRSFDDEVVWYRARFDAPDEGVDVDWTLGFDGLATAAEVWLNGKKLLSSRNMFRRWTVSVGERLRARDNELLLRFDALNERLRERRARPRWRVPMLEQQQLRWWRTTLLGRTPGWSPPAAVVGPWLPIWIERSDAPQPEVRQRRAWIEGTDGCYQVVIAVRARSTKQGQLCLRRNGCTLVQQMAVVPSSDGARHLGATLRIPRPALWWPHTHGEPALYEAWFEITDADETTHRWPLGNVGFRQLRLASEDGAFAVHVNDVAVFCRGACWTPLDPLRLRAEPQAYEAAIRQLRTAGMNMLRVVGTMAWESAALFDACDRHGVLIWHDLMLANMDYPAEDLEFLDELRTELIQQLPSLQARPCLALVCGNSEVAQQAAMWGLPPALWQPDLFHVRIPAWVAEALPDALYWPSSASGGDFPHQPREGSCSYYGVGAYQRPLEDARHSGVRFASECLAFASIPSDDTLARLPGGRVARVHQPSWKARVPRDLGAGWDFDDVRDHYVERLFGERADALRHADPSRHLALGRAASAEAMARAFTQWRASDSSCSGALVWFLRDLWAGAGWGLLDDQGQPKSTFHALSRVLQPIWIGVVDDGLNGLALHWAQETSRSIDATLQIHAWRQGEQLVAHGQAAVELTARGRGRIALTTVLDGFTDLNWAYRFGPVAVELLQARLLDTNGKLLASTLHFDPSLISRRGPVGLIAASARNPDGSMQVRLTSRAAALGVHFDARGWLPSDEYFHMAPGAERTLHFTALPGTGARSWNASVMALNTYEMQSMG